MKLKLDLCCGPRKPDGYFGIDSYPFPEVDLIYDLNYGIPLEDNRCCEVRAHDAIEHMIDGMKMLKEIWRVCVDDALVDILVPSTDGRGAFQDLTHKSFWNQNSFGYWLASEPWADYYRGPCLFSAQSLYTTPMSADNVCHVIFKGRTIKNENWMTLYNSRNKPETKN